MGLRCTIGAPIIVNGRVWGMAAMGSSAADPLPPDAEARIGDFADLVATAIANADARFQLQASRDALGVLARQQAALRRVATLVARGVSQADVFTAVAEEMARCLGVENAEVFRYEPDGGAVIVASYAEPGEPHLPVGENVTLEGDNVAAAVLRTSRPARMDDYGRASGSLAGRLREMGVRCRVGAPIVVDERVWGMAVVGSSRAEPLPVDIEDGIAEFAELVATAIAAATTRTDLIASRARIVTAGDEARRRLERDLHDGAQQRLVSLGLQLRMAEDSTPPELQDHKQQLAEIVSGLTAVSEDLQEISRGIHPAILSRGGLTPALKTLARRSAIPVTLDLTIDRRFADPIEVATYYVVAEALTNAAKHAQASEVTVSARSDADNLYLVIRDDGIGGADPGKGSGLIGLKDRVEALGGQIEVSSPTGRGTSLRITIPLNRS
jgi:signal transduction histidine kinase